MGLFVNPKDKDKGMVSGNGLYQKRENARNCTVEIHVEALNSTPEDTSNIRRTRYQGQYRLGGSMRVPDDRRKRTVRTVRRGLLTLGLCLLGFAGIIWAGGQDLPAQSHVVAVQSNPPGAMIWKKDGREYTCTNTLTPGTVELTFHGDNDLKRLRVRRFGYSGMNLDVKATDKEVGGALNLSDYESLSFQLADGATPNLIQLNAALKAEFEKTLLGDQEAFRCAPFDLYFIHLVPAKETGDVYLNVALRLDRSFGGPAFRLASHAPNAHERRQKMGQAALESGIAEVLARFHRVAARFPDVKVIFVLCSYATTEAVLKTEYAAYDHARQVHDALEVTTVVESNDVVKDKAAEKVITFMIPTAQIPDTLDKKAISEAALASGKIILPGSAEEVLPFHNENR